MTSLHTHYSCAELAAMKLPGLPTSVRGVIDRARKEGWPSRQVPGKGGKGGLRTEYQLSAILLAVPETHRQAFVDAVLKAGTGGSDAGRSVESNDLSSPDGEAYGSRRGCADGNTGGAILCGDGLVSGTSLLPLERGIASVVAISSGRQLGGAGSDGRNGQGNMLHAGANRTDEQPTAVIPFGENAATLKDWQRTCGLARLALLHELTRLSAILGGQEAAITQLIRLAGADEQISRLAMQANAKSGKLGKRTLSIRTLKRWKSAVSATKDRAQMVVALAPKEGAVQRIKPWALPLLSLYGQPQKPTLASCLERLPEILPEGVSVPSYWAAQRFLDKMSKLDLERGRMGPRELKSVRAYVKRDTSQMWPGDAYTADGHTFDAEVSHPAHGRPFRPEITSVLDIATRKSVGWSIDLAESTWAVLDALHNAVETGGIPAIFYVDNGSGYKNALMGDEATGFMARLGITISHSLPYNSQARGIIERSHQTIWVRGAKELPTYMGAPMDREAKQSSFKITRADIKTVGTSSLLMPWSEFTVWCQAQVDAYNNRPHRGLPKITDAEGKRRHQTPNEAWAQAIVEGWKPVEVEATEAADLFRPYKEVTTRRALVQLFSNSYFHRDLEHYHGEKVRVGYDIHDANHVWVRDRAGRLICVAEFEGNKRSYFPMSAIVQAAEKRAKGRIKRAEAKIEEAEAELNPPLQIEHQPAQQIDFSSTLLPRNEAVPVGVAGEVDETPATASKLVQSKNVVALPTTTGGRPRFTEDIDLYRWIMDQPEMATENDWGYIKTRMEESSEFAAQVADEQMMRAMRSSSSSNKTGDSFSLANR